MKPLDFFLWALFSLLVFYAFILSLLHLSAPEPSVCALECQELGYGFYRGSGVDCVCGDGRGFSAPISLVQSVANLSLYDYESS